MLNRLLHHPAIRRSATIGVIFGTGDVIAQSILNRGDVWNQYDKYRTLRAVTYGGLIFGPLQAFVTYPFVNKLGNGLPAWKAGLYRTAVDQLAIGPFIYIPLYFSATALLEGKGPDVIVDRVTQNWARVVTVGLSVWVPAQYINFTFVPVNFRIVFAGMVGLLWNTFLAIRNKKVGDAEEAQLAQLGHLASEKGSSL